MEILQIWVKEGGFTWLVGAFDSESLAETDEPFLKDKNAAIESYGADNVRIIIQSIDMEQVHAAFEPTRVDGGTVRTEGVSAGGSPSKGRHPISLDLGILDPVVIDQHLQGMETRLRHHGLEH